MVLHKAGLLVPRPISVSTELAAAYRAAGTVYREGALEPAGEVFAMNFLLDRDAAGWRRDLATLKARVGDCDTSAAIDASSALAGEFTWRCAHGRVSGSVLLAPTRPARIQEIKLAPIDP
jgi:hypothetical protein